jgi:hypothetical protein
VLGNGDAIDAAVINDAVNIMVSFSVLSLQIGRFDHLKKLLLFYFHYPCLHFYRFMIEIIEFLFF